MIESDEEITEIDGIEIEAGTEIMSDRGTIRAVTIEEEIMTETGTVNGIIAMITMIMNGASGGIDAEYVTCRSG